jgi:hypothetical protein
MNERALLGDPSKNILEGGFSLVGKGKKAR